MGLLGRRAPEPGSSSGPRHAPLRVLRADGRRIDLASRDTSKYLAATKQAWQVQSFEYRDLIGELRYAVRLLSTAVARVQFYPAEVRAWPDKPVALDSEECTLPSQVRADAQANFDRLPFDHQPDGFTARLVENLKLPGEAWIHIDADDTIRVRSISEITTGAGGNVAIATLPGGAGSRPLNPDTEELLRVWVPHPEYGDLADSPMRALAHVAEDVVLAGREQRAAARSRLAANGVLLVPEEMSILKEREDDDGDLMLSDTFLADLTAAFMAPIYNVDEDPAQIVPIVLRGKKEDLDGVQHLTVSRADSAQLVERQSAALLRLLKGMDVQPEQVDGVGGMNHWGAWIIDARAIKDQVEPTAETLAACLLQAFLKPALLTLGHDPADVARITIAIDVSDLSENPNRGQDARDAYAAGVISAETLRRELGFDDTDAPSDDELTAKTGGGLGDKSAELTKVKDAHAAIVISDETYRRELGFTDADAPSQKELVQRAALTGKLPVADTAKLLGLHDPTVVDATPVDAAPSPTPGQAPMLPGLPAALPPGGSSTSTPQPAGAKLPDAPTGISASATPAAELGLAVADDLARRLTDIDAALAERIAVAADAAIARVLERAGAKVRSQAQKDRALAARLTGVDAHLVASALGRQQVEAFISVPDLLADGYSRLKGQVIGWIGGAAAQTADTLLAALGIRKGHARYKALRAELLARLTARTAQAWDELARILDAAAERALFADDPLNPDPPGEGERSGGLVRPREIADVLTVAGGGQPPASDADDQTPRSDPAGFATGPAVLETARQEGAVLLGWEWHYRAELPRDPYGPHEDLDGIRFASWNDPQLATDAKSAWLGAYFHPRDHKGCLCQAGPILIMADPDSDANEALRKAAGNPSKIPIPELRQRVVDAVDDMRQTALKKPRRKR